MTTIQGVFRNFIGRKGVATKTETAVLSLEPIQETPELNLDIAPNDPLLSYVQQSSGVIEVNRLQLESPALDALRDAGVQLIVPLISQGELIGLINLGARMSEQEYSSDDRKLLSDLATQAAPALRVAQLVRQQQMEAAERERIQQELRVARIIQQTLLPRELPALPGWDVSAYYQPARAVGGDFYDFIYYPDGKVGFIVADVTDKGVPAALVMATTRSILRAAAERLVHPGQVLARTNDVLQKEIPPKMFVTCFYALLTPENGRLTFANAGHDVPYHYTAAGVAELRATGMPLGLLPGMNYDEKETVLAPGEYVLLYSDGLVEAHNPQREMFGFPRLKRVLGEHGDDSNLTQFLLDQLSTFTGPDWVQEDDVTLVTMRREAASLWQPLATFDIVSAPGNERLALKKVTEMIGDRLPRNRLQRLETAVAEATMNAMEHGNQHNPDKPVKIELATSKTAVRVRISDQGGGSPIDSTVTPDLYAKLSGEQSPRGWGLFLIKNMVDEMHIIQDDHQHTVELLMQLTEEK